ncbi:hypothetical protein LCGC14_2137670 [marine sediment metagenome]|uniref:Uncharacterized protein n=1 Tax=marine sediment metagenome TaxID=412755 RepID=A0A0F9GCE5_9ZZZZ
MKEIGVELSWVIMNVEIENDELICTHFGEISHPITDKTFKCLK